MIPDLPATSFSHVSNPEVELPSDHESDHNEPSEVPEVEEEQYDYPQQNLRDYQLARDRSRRTIRPHARYAYSYLVYSALVVGMEMKSTEPTSYEEAVSSHDCSKWQQVMDNEMNSLITNNVTPRFPWALGNVRFRGYFFFQQ